MADIVEFKDTKLGISTQTGSEDGTDTLAQMTEMNMGGAAVVGEAPAELKVPSDNIYTVIEGRNGKIALEALGDQVIIVQDKYKTGFECRACDGVGHLGVQCKWCKGTGVEPGSDDNPQGCRLCYGRSYQGFVACEDCKGRGGLLIAPDISQKKPTTGTITSIGPKVVKLKVGDRVLFGMFAGQDIDFRQKVVVRIAHEHELMCKLHGTGKVGDRSK